jgi:transketolase
VNTIKGLAMDAVQAANSGHPGMPMGTADMATVLWTRFLKHDPADPQWPDRDRFILSAGHGSMLLYSLLHLSGHDLSLQDIKDFRQWGSKTPGHPEFGHTAGVETTTGPLGQGISNGVGMALAERFLRETFGADLCDHWTYGICSDGDLMEGVAAEAASLAGHLGLGRLVFLYDDNEITIDGGTDLSYTENSSARLAACGWHVQRVNGHDAAAIAAALVAAREVTDRPSLIACRTVIGQGSPSFEGTSRTHGAPLGAEEIRATKARLGMDPDVSFAVPDDAVAAFRAHDGARHRAAWEARLAAHPRADEFKAWLAGDASALVNRVNWPSFEVGTKLATRKASAACLKAIYAETPWFIGGSADLAGSNGTNIGAQPFGRERFEGAGTIHFGVREHGMGAICNGIALHGGARPYCATFLIFHDYHRPSVRLSGLMGLPVTWIYTHDSVFLGEDGPTHQPIATLLALRSIPNLDVWRPADAAETLEAWKATILRKDGPSSLVLTRQGLPIYDRSTLGAVDGVHRGGYVLRDTDGNADVLLLATGSEVATCMDAAELLSSRGIQARVVSLPCRERFWAQDSDYRNSVLTPGVPRVSLEAGVTLGWERWTGSDGLCLGIDTFGHSAPASVIAEKLGFTGAQVADRAAAHIGR